MRACPPATVAVDGALELAGISYRRCANVQLLRLANPSVNVPDGGTVVEGAVVVAAMVVVVVVAGEVVVGALVELVVAATVVVGATVVVVTGAVVVVSATVEEVVDDVESSVVVVVGSGTDEVVDDSGNVVVGVPAGQTAGTSNTSSIVHTALSLFIRMMRASSSSGASGPHRRRATAIADVSPAWTNTRAMSGVSLSATGPPSGAPTTVAPPSAATTMNGTT
jgi:hypothetical protein